MPNSHSEAERAGFQSRGPTTTLALSELAPTPKRAQLWLDCSWGSGRITKAELSRSKNTADASAQDSKAERRFLNIL